ncbi:MAG: D-alanyl-D-alanine carboxypeptidase [Lachnospiraceae bacterium]|nr:D-alanyl-D-alanine carboxypeptidase [Lachnospiraceae bacterium]
MHSYRKLFPNKFIKALSLGLTVCVLTLSQAFPSLAITADERVAQHRAMTIQSNEITNWPTGPVVSAESAILMEAETGAILYAKNIHQQEYPASTTKILTCLIAAERCQLDEWVTFSHDAVFDTPYNSNHIAMDVGEKLTMEDCLNAILIRSANEVAYAVGEHIAGTGSWEDFGPIMNERARELGALGSNFVNPNGLPDENHYTTAYDLAMIGRAFFENELLCKISTTKQLRIEPTEYQTDLKIENSSNQMLPGRTYAYEYLIGAKTGYTNAARSSLVTCAEKDGMKLICVVLKDESPYQYEDTIALFNYGFSNFDKVNVSQLETKYDIDNSLFYTENAIFGSSKPLLALNTQDSIVLPKTIDFEDVTSTISYETNSQNQVAEITYTYQDTFIGSASIDFVQGSDASYDFEAVTEDLPENVISDDSSSEEPASSPKKDNSFIYVNWMYLLIGIAVLLVAALLILLIRTYLSHFHFGLPGFFSRFLHRGRDNWSDFSSSRAASERRMNAKRKAEIKRAKARQKRKFGRNRFGDYD